jgi:SAM-dependent methyltransferase
MSESPSELVEQHLAAVREHYEGAPVDSNWAARGYRSILAHYYNLLIPADATVLEIGCGSGELLAQLRAAGKAGVDLSAKRIAAAQERLPEATFAVQAGEELDLPGTYDVIVISDTINSAADVQRLFNRLHRVSHPGTRLLLNYHSSLWRPFFVLAQWLGLRRRGPDHNWLATSDVLNLLQLADWQRIAVQHRLLLPVPCAGLDRLVNRWLAPLLTRLCLTVFIEARPVRRHTGPAPTVSVIIPARNEAGNIEAAVRRTPMMGAGTELIFVEGHSRDHTWAEIQRVSAAYPERRITCLQQTGKGKGDAVRAGFAAATGDILMILDADLTMPPEELPKFYEVVASGHAEFANGCRLVYPMDEKAMQFLNLCANKVFGLIFSWLLGQPIKDTLCGTKVLSRAHYERIAANRGYFGDFDPFGDFDLLFGAAKQNLQIADVPIRYKERTYGATNIQRWKHGWLLLRMVWFAARKLKFV